jgi:hypothetical protein
MQGARCGLPAWDALKTRPLQLSRKPFCLLVPSGGAAGEKREWKKRLVNSLNASDEKIVADESDLVDCVTKIRAAQEVCEA